MRRSIDERAAIYRAKAEKLDLAKRRLELTETNATYCDVCAALKALERVRERADTETLLGASMVLSSMKAEFERVG